MTFWHKPATGAVTGRVFFDANGDNTENNGTGGFDVGVGHVTVQLLDAHGNVKYTTTSDAHGNYRFDAAPGDYKVKFVAPADLVFVQNDVGADGEDSDAGPGGITVGFARVVSGQTVQNIDAGLKPAFAIDAVNDHITVTESERSGDSDGSVLGNDTSFGVSAPTVTAVNGAAVAVGQFVDVAGGGKIKINANGTIDFDADGDFEDLNNGQSRDVTVHYTISSTRPVSGGTNLLVNGDFETHSTLTRNSISGGGKWDVFDTISGWRTPVGKLELQSGTVNGAPSNDKNNTVLELDSDDATDTNATVVQDVTITSAGTYTFSFSYSPRQTGNNTASTSEAKILVNGVVIDTITSNTLGYKHFSYTVTLAAGVNTVGFQAGGLDDSVGALIDNVSLKQTAAVITDTATVKITVTGETDNVAPVITTGNVSSAENQTAVTTLAASDANGNTVTWSISGADSALFNVNATTGALTWKVAPNFEAPTDAGGNNVYDVTAIANDGQGGVTSKALAITVTNVNEAPVITTGNLSTPENQVAIATLAAADADGDAVTWAISGVDAAFFNINANTGALSWKVAPNFEAPQSVVGNDNIYDLVLTANDGQGGVTSKTIGVIVTNVNEAPVITTGNLSTPENQVAIATLSATDADSNAVTWSISGVDAAFFNINANTGALTWKAAPDFEAPQSVVGNDNIYDLVLTANDGQGGVTSKTIGVIVTNVNEAPVITQGTFLSVVENNTVVRTVTAVDPDAGAVVTWSIAGADAALFTIDPATGALAFITAADFETPLDALPNRDNVYNVDIIANDGQGGVASKTLFISVTNVNEAPVITSGAAVSVAENTTAVTTVTAVDPDAGAVVGFALSGADAARFTINAGGVLSFVAAPNFEAPTDAGANNVYNVIVTASDGLGGTTSQALAVTVTNVNEAPVITSGAAVSVAENTTAVTTVTAVDPDAGAVVGFALSGADAARFTINAGGVLSFVAAPNFEAPTDAGANNVYNVIVTASDGLGGTTSQALAVTVTDVAENVAPVFVSPAAVSVAENLTAVTTVAANDGNGDVVTLTLGGADAALFALDPATGALTFLVAPNFEAPGDAGGNNVYDLVVTANDGNGGVTTQGLVVTVTDANDAPVIVSGATATVDENTTTVATVVADDEDGDTLTFAIVGGDDAPLFEIDPVTGALNFIAAPNFEAPDDADGDNTYTVQVAVQDGAGGVDLQDIVVTVADANDAPVITSAPTAAVAENTTTVATVTAVDEDGDIPTFTLGGPDAALFEIDPITGEISFIDAPNFEAPGDQGDDNTYNVTVTTDDGQGGTDTQDIAVTVTDANDAPVITSAAAAAIDENDTDVLTVTADDEDGDTLSFTIAGGADALLFAIDAATGKLSFIAAPDAELPGDVGDDNVYDVSVLVSDGNGGSDTQAIAVTVNNIAETGALDDAYSVVDGDLLVIGAAAGLLANDEVAAGGTLVVTAPGGAVAGSAGGSFIIGADGSVAFDPEGDFVSLGDGETVVTEITYQIADGLGGTGTGTVSVEVTGINDDPIYLDSAFDNELDPFNVGPQNGLVALEVGSGGPEVITDILFAADPDANDTLVFTLEGEDAALFTIDIDPLDPALFGDFGIIPPVGFSDFATIRPAQFLDTASLSTDGDQLFEFTVVATDSFGASISTDYEVLIT